MEALNKTFETNIGFLIFMFVPYRSQYFVSGSKLITQQHALKPVFAVRWKFGAQHEPLNQLMLVGSKYVRENLILLNPAKRKQAKKTHKSNCHFIEACLSQIYTKNEYLRIGISNTSLRCIFKSWKWRLK